MTPSDKAAVNRQALDGVTRGGGAVLTSSFNFLRLVRGVLQAAVGRFVLTADVAVVVAAYLAESL